MTTHDPSLHLDRRQRPSPHFVVAIACDIKDIRAAASYLDWHGIPIEIALRVLLRPSQRRRGS